jgi:hypothetical protein
VYSIPDKFLESPVLALYEAVGALALHGLGLLALGIEDAELELGPHLALVARHCPARPFINQSVQSISFERQSISFEWQSISFEWQSISFEWQSINFERQSISFERNNFVQLQLPHFFMVMKAYRGR